MNLTKTMPTLSTPIAAYGIADVSRPMAAALLGVSVKALSSQIAEGQIAAAGRVQKTVSIDEIEALTAKPVTVHDYLSSRRRVEGQRRRHVPSTKVPHDGRRPAV
jgi:hypothetical protein